MCTKMVLSTASLSALEAGVSAKFLPIIAHFMYFLQYNYLFMIVNEFEVMASSETAFVQNSSVLFLF